MVEITKYNLHWFKFTYNVLWCGLLAFIGFRLMVIALEFFSEAQGREEQLLWIIIIALMGFTIKFRFPNFNRFYTIERWEED